MQPLEKIVQLRQLLAERFPHIRANAELPSNRMTARWPTGLESLDSALAGGLPKGGLTEVVTGPSGTGGALLIRSLLRQAQLQRLALIDGVDSFDPGALDNVALSRLLWVRCRNVEESLKAADVLLRDGNLPLVMLDLGFNSAGQLRKISGSVWFRLQRVLAPTPTAVMVITPQALVNGAVARVVLTGRFIIDALAAEENELLGAMQFELLQHRAVAGEGG